MKNSEVYAYIERLFDVIHSGLPDCDIINETLDVLMDFEDEVYKQMQAEDKQKSGIESTPFFAKLAEADDEELINFCERMDEIHPRIGKFMSYLMEEDDPAFFIAYGEDTPTLTGRSSDKWAFETATSICHRLLERGSLNDK